MSKSILIVDDSPSIRRVLHETLERRGYQVRGEAANGREGIEMAQQLKPDLVVLDLSMPVMNGLDAASELRRLFPLLPLLMFTNFDTPQVIRVALSAGVTALVSKSESMDALVRGIQALLEPTS